MQFIVLKKRAIMHFANVKQRQILPRVGKIWASTPQKCPTTNRAYFYIGGVRLGLVRLQTAPTGLEECGEVLKPRQQMFV